MRASSRFSRRLAVAGGLTAARATRAQAQPWPIRPIRALIGFPPGTPPDVAMRLLAPAMAELLGQRLVVENRPGASGMLAAEALLRAPPDGHTLLMMPHGTLLLPALARSIPYDSADLLPIAGAALAPMVLIVAPSLGVGDLDSFLALARARGDRLSFGTSGPTSAPRRAMAQLAMATGIAPTPVTYRGDSDVATAILSGQVEAGFVFLGVALEHVRDGRLRALGVTSARRVGWLPGVPSMAELGQPGVDLIGTWSLTVPRRTPDALQHLLIAAANTARSTTAFRERLVGAGALPFDLDAAALRAELERMRAQEAALLQRLGVQPE